MSLQHSPQPRFQRGRHLPLKLGPAETVLSSSWGALPRAKALRRVFIRGQEWKIHHAQGRKFHSEGPLSWIHVGRPQGQHSYLPGDGFPTFPWGRPARTEEQLCLPLGPIITPSQLRAIIPQGPNEHLLDIRPCGSYRRDRSP